MLKLAFVVLVTLGLTACGGGGDACSGSGNLSLTLTWTSNGADTGSFVIGKVGQALTAAPVLHGLPSSCGNRVVYTLAPGMLAPGLIFDPITGRLSGIPTQTFSASAQGAFTAQPDGYNAATFPFGIRIDP